MVWSLLRVEKRLGGRKFIHAFSGHRGQWPIQEILGLDLESDLGRPRMALYLLETKASVWVSFKQFLY
jgi:hypothetical protein